MEEAETRREEVFEVWKEMRKWGEGGERVEVKVRKVHFSSGIKIPESDRILYKLIKFIINGWSE